MNHSFDIEIATEIGITEAIILENMIFWQARNQANENNFFDDHYWTYNSVKAYGELFPYLTRHKIQSALTNLEAKGYIISSNYNKVKFDRTKWFSVIHKTHLLKNGNGVTEKRQPIPDINTDSKPDINNKNIYTKKSIEERKKEFAESVWETICDLDPLVIKGPDSLKYMPDQNIFEFIAHWTETNSRGKMRREGENYFDMVKRLATWKGNINRFNKPSKKVFTGDKRGEGETLVDFCARVQSGLAK